MVGLLWHFWSDAVDNDYLFYWADISNSKGTHFPVYIRSRTSGTFENVDPWWAPWGSEKSASPTDPNTPYMSIGHQMKVFFPFVRWAVLYGRAIPVGDYLIQYDATLKDTNYHFDEHLIIIENDGSLVQKIDVWKMTVPDSGDRALVYSADSSINPIP